MFIAIHHNIRDPKAWEETTNQIGPMIEEGRLPRGVKPLFYLPAADGHRADCLWEADSMETLKQFLDPLTSKAARNDYIEINAEQAFGLPAQATESAAAR